SITWTVPTADATRFVCTIDGATVACSGTMLPYDLQTGQHTFTITAFDQFDNPSVNPPSNSTVTFTVDADRPVVVAGPPPGAPALGQVRAGDDPERHGAAGRRRQPLLRGRHRAVPALPQADVHRARAAQRAARLPRLWHRRGRQPQRHRDGQLHRRPQRPAAD